MSRESRLAYDQFMAQQRHDRMAAGGQTGDSAQNIRTRQTLQRDWRGRGVQFDMPDAAPQSAAIVAGQPLNELASNRPSVTMGRMNLYGHLPKSQKSGQSSPLDSVDNLRQVTFASEGADFDPAVDPTGTLLAYASTQHRATADLYLKRINGTALQQLTTDPANDVMPAFSPDGKKIAFASDRSGNWDIYLMDITGGQAVQLTNDLTHDLSPSFSPDGKQLVYCTFGTQSGQWELVIIDVENPATKSFIGFGLFPAWSPQDNRILFQRARERGTRWFSLWTVEMVNGEGVRPTEVAASSNAAAISPAWSPDAQHIAFSTVIDPESDQQLNPIQADIWIINADGSGRSNLTNSQFANLNPVWAKDGSIFFVSNRAKNGIENIWAIRPDRALRVTEPMTAQSHPSAMGPAPQNRGRLNPLMDRREAMAPTR